MEYCVILITVPNQAVGARIAKTLVEEKLAACVNRIPGVISVYAWQGKIEQATEELLMVKTRQNLTATVSQRVKSLHPYEVPEIVALPITGGSEAYLKWLAGETQAAPAD